MLVFQTDPLVNAGLASQEYVAVVVVSVNRVVRPYFYISIDAFQVWAPS